MNSPNGNPVALNSSQTLDASPVVGLNSQDLAELGAKLTGAGFTTLQVRGFLARVQQTSAQVALSTAADLLEDIRRTQESRFLDMLQQIRLLPNLGGYVSRDKVLAVVQNVAMSQPRQ